MYACMYVCMYVCMYNGSLDFKFGGRDHMKIYLPSVYNRRRHCTSFHTHIHYLYYTHHDHCIVLDKLLLSLLWWIIHIYMCIYIYIHRYCEWQYLCFYFVAAVVVVVCSSYLWQSTQLQCFSPSMLYIYLYNKLISNEVDAIFPW